jgi:hypothetical protein
MMIRHRYLEAGGLALGLLLIVFLAFSGGAQPKHATLTGSVTYDGKPLKFGTIAFFPTQGGVTTGGLVIEGHYSVAGISLGKNRVEITAEQERHEYTYDWYFENEKMKLIAKAEGKRLAALGMTDQKVIEPLVRKTAGMPEKLMPDDAIGNNQIVDVGTESMSIDFKLEPPAPRPSGRP